MFFFYGFCMPFAAFGQVPELVEIQFHPQHQKVIRPRFELVAHNPPRIQVEDNLTE